MGLPRVAQAAYLLRTEASRPGGPARHDGVLQRRGLAVGIQVELKHKSLSSERACIVCIVAHRLSRLISSAHTNNHYFCQTNLVGRYLPTYLNFVTITGSSPIESLVE